LPLPGAEPAANESAAYLAAAEPLARSILPNPRRGPADYRAGAPDLGRLGVVWHTQGSGKSYSMAFFAEKVRRTVPGNFTLC
jgi:type I restriction enzyme R subunit